MRDFDIECFIAGNNSFDTIFIDIISSSSQCDRFQILFNFISYLELVLGDLFICKGSFKGSKANLIGFAQLVCFSVSIYINLLHRFNQISSDFSY